MHDREANNSQATGRVGSVEKVKVESEDKAKRGYIKAESEQLSKSCSRRGEQQPQCFATREVRHRGRKTQSISPKSGPLHD